MLLTRLHAEIVTPLHVLNQTKSKGFLVLPGGGTTRAVLERSDRLVPLPTTLDGVTFKVVASRETEESLCELLDFDICTSFRASLVWGIDYLRDPCPSWPASSLCACRWGGHSM